MSPADGQASAHRPFNRSDAKTLGLSALGGALEFYDFVVFVFFAKTLSVLFFPAGTAPWLSQLQVYGIFAAGYLARPLGGIVMAHFGDLVGRKRMFTLSVFLMSVPTLLIGLLPTYAQVGLLAPLLLLLLRIVQGIAVGGEVPGAWVFVSEHVPRNRVGFACASLTAGLTAGILIGSLLAAWINTRFEPQVVLDWVWRVPFLLGGVFGFFAVYLRRWLHETPVFTEMRERKQLAQSLPVKQVLARHRGAVALSMLASWQLTAAIVVVVLMTPTLIQAAFDVPAALAFRGNSVATFCLVIGCVVAGLAVDRFGVARSLLTGSLGLMAGTYALYLHLASGSVQHFVALYALAGFFCGVVGVVPALMVAAFPPAIRFSGLSFSYNIAYAIFGGLTPPLIGYLSQALGSLAPAHYVALTGVVSIGVAAYLLIARRPAP
ncbi:Predicted arabinose efflux permease, MFS family [Pseudoxanthomonas wuyuanensis]|uniref:Predicted arabinose efflux permease, MFS family n=1 Tax=Pseudoxanthomonas wuyuanensis TaxID=1073196 RepID=A0A286DDV3_9GAMM|nr:MFS transporter [Pseudoxanthomonas wuyuanensis]SOD56852.1 Predicted arabinose efflux permease, MFS family [Pseudoxanthomonas wuyuanensis]